MQTDFQTLVDQPPLKIRYVQGSSPTLVISFAGIGGVRNQEPPVEFFKVASNGGANHVLFVSDIQRSWLNAPGMAEKIVETIEHVKNNISARRIVTLGNSMGGFAALQIARLVHVDTVAAFSPQYSVDPEIVPDEVRWVYFRRNIANYRFRTMDRLPAAPTGVYIFQGGTPPEKYHWQRFPFADNTDQYIFPDIGHNLAHRLKQRGALQPVVSNIIAGRRRRVRQLVKANGGINRPSGE